jgi:AcrR family transcriptional regulator
MPHRPSRTQEERRSETRSKLLDATIQSVLDGGYAATTIRGVAERAGVSQGAQTHHFPRRVDLVGAAVEQLAEQRTAELRELAADLPTARADRLPALLDLLWTDFSSSIFAVFVKLWVAAADDPELYARLVPVERQIARSIASLAEEFVGELATGPGLETRLLVVLSALRGLALTERFEPRGRQRRNPWPETRAGLLEFLSAGAP